MAQITAGFRAILSHAIVYDIFQNIMGAKKSRQELVKRYIRPERGCRILDIGCGTADILEYLPADVEYWGVDSSELYITAANRRFGNRGNFKCIQIGESTLSDLSKFDIVLALGVLHHLDDALAINLIKLAHLVLKSGGRLVTVDPVLVPDQNILARFLIRNDRGQNVRNGHEYELLAMSSFSNIKSVIRHQKWIPYTNWIMECEI